MYQSVCLVHVIYQLFNSNHRVQLSQSAWYRLQQDPLLGLMNDLASLGYIFRQDSYKPEYTMDKRVIPNPILQMAFLKLYIPLSLLTTTALDNNDGLKYQNILSGNRAGKHTLDISLFPNELSLSESEFWQAYCNWLSLIKIITEPVLANGWRMHHIGMMMDKNFSTWFLAWRVHDWLLCVQFMVNPFILNLNHPSYVHQFKRCRGDQTCNDLLATISLLKDHTSGLSNPKPSSFQLYLKDGPHNHSFHPTFCV